MTDLDDPAAVRAAAEAAGRLEMQCSMLREQYAAAEERVPVALPDWAALTAAERKQAARLLLRCVIAEADTLHAVMI